MAGESKTQLPGLAESIEKMGWNRTFQFLKLPEQASSFYLGSHSSLTALSGGGDRVQKLEGMGFNNRPGPPVSKQHSQDLILTVGPEFIVIPP